MYKADTTYFFPLTEHTDGLSFIVKGQGGQLAALPLNSLLPWEGLKK